MHYLKQSTITTIQLGPFLDETDGKTAEEGLTIEDTDVYLSKAGAAFANPNDTNNAAHDRAGWYRKQLDATDTATVGRLIVSVHESGALPVWREFIVLTAKVYESLVDGTDYLEVDIEAVSGDETAADNLELDYDGTGYAKANSTIGTVTANTDLVSAASVRTEMDSNSTQLTAIVADTNELQTDDVPGLIAALNDVSTAEVNAEVDTALVDIHLDHLLAVNYDPASKPGAATALMNEMVVNDLGVPQFTSNALENSPSGGASAAECADAVWDEAISVHVALNSFGKQVQLGALTTEIDALNDVSTAEVNAEVDTALSDIHLDHLLAADYDPASKPGTATALLNELVENDGGVSRFTANALEEAPSGGASAGDIADAVWDEASTGHTDAGKAGEQLWTDVDAILADTNELQADDTPAAIAALNDISTAEVNAEVDTALADIHLDHLLAADYDPASKPGTGTALLNELVESDGGVSRFTANALEEAPSGGASAGDIADAVWEEPIADHSGTSGSTAEALDGASAPSAADVADAVWDEDAAGHTGSGTAGGQQFTLMDYIYLDTNELQTDDIPGKIAALPTAAENRTEMDSNSTKLADIVADTNELQVDDIPGKITALNDPTAGAIADQVWEEALADHSGTSGSTAEALSQIPGAAKGAIEYTYTIDDGSNPIDGAEVWITTDSGGNNVIWSGVSDALGVARASDDEKPWLDAGAYYGWAQKAGYSFSNPNTLAVS